MSKNKDTEKTRELTEDELNTVSGGNLANSVSSARRALRRRKSVSVSSVASLMEKDHDHHAQFRQHRSPRA
jgi:bacteriocin-like protein